MKILYVATVSSTINAFLIPHIKMLVDNGNNVDVASNETSQYQNELLKLVGTKYDIPFSRSPQKNNFKKLINQMKRIIIDNNYDMVHTHTPVASAIVRIACRNIPNVQVIYTAHGFHFYKGAPIKNWLIYYPIEKWLSSFTDTIITINQEDYSRAQKFSSKKTVYMPGVGIDLKKFSSNDEYSSNNIRKKLNIDDDEIVLLSIGELSKRKNHKVVIEAMGKLQNKKIHYVIAGKGLLELELMKLAEKLNVSNQLHLLGFRKDIPELLKMANVFVLPSLQEGLPVSLMEAMAMKKPVIVSDIRGNADLVISNKGGELFRPNDAEQLSIIIKNIVSDPKLMENYGKFNLNKVKEYDIEEIILKLKEIYFN